MGEVGYVKNAIVKDNYWKIDNFFETKANGYVAAAMEYNVNNSDVPVLVIFKNRNIYLIMDENGEDTCTLKDFKELLAGMNKSGSIEDELETILDEESLITLGVANYLDDDGRQTLINFGLTDDQIADVEARAMDLSGYYKETVTDAV